MTLRPALPFPATMSGVLILLFLGVGVLEATAASVAIKGPAGASVVIDGQPRGILPLAAPVELDPGTHALQCELAGHRRHEETFDLEDRDHVLTLTVDLLPLSRVKATGYSLVLAGLGQRYQGRRTASWAMLTTQLAAAAVAIYAENQFKDKRSEFEDAYALYHQSVDSRTLQVKRAEAEAAYDDMESAQTLRNVALWTVAGAAIVSAVDAWIAHDGLIVRVGEPGGDRAAFDRPLQVGWRARF